MARFRTVSDRSLSLWQSAVTETVQKQAGVQEPVKTDAEEKETEETEKPIQQCLVEGSCLFTTEQNLILAALGIQVKQEQNTAGNEGTAQGSVEDRHEDKAERKTESSAGVTAGEERADRHMGDRKVSADEASEGVETEAVMTSPNTGDAVLNLPDTASDMGQASRLMFEAALAKAEGSEEEALRLMREARKYSTGDLAGWLSCITTYLEYDARYDAPYYRDWKLDGRDIGTYGVVSHVLPGDAKVGLIGDWATGMPDARELIACILDQDVDAVIHLGDTYYSGTPEECRRNFKEVFDEVFAKTGKPRIPVYSIPGNHDYYAFGYGFYQEILDEINRGEPEWKQEASYFCLRTEDGAWQFLGMDTGRNDYSPYNGINPTYDGPWLEESEVEWHRDKLANFKGSTLLLSHHQLFSQHSAIQGWGAQRPWLNEHLEAAFSPFFDRIACWFWGHEHNLCLFRDGLMGLAKGRLVGCSAYEETSGKDPYAPYRDDYAEHVPYREEMPRVSQTDGYYNHAFAILEFKREAKEDPITCAYYEFPSWGSNAPEKRGAKLLMREFIHSKHFNV
ncbi:MULTISPECIES: metallophosphoesterase [Paenibacillus]|uniref:metallophosphoesterase family protein n=1 Tax=Paenibacillus TaxID=44249 RepID=UPI00020D65FA|nr:MULTISPECIES: metallophosphoesterase [Paenibacillus]EGL20279.1 Ser/Thr phosphatase family protein [Paenibacillus sp. HGF7]EPD88965.1 hypothetical protein HMPREF1207_01708 [Paenibacillus sp. HGH0039]MBV6716981.1 metallophosphoesterase [Paenibacillus chitinolyticus]